MCPWCTTVGYTEICCLFDGFPLGKLPSLLSLLQCSAGGNEWLHLTFGLPIKILLSTVQAFFSVEVVSNNNFFLPGFYSVGLISCSEAVHIAIKITLIVLQELLKYM